MKKLSLLLIILFALPFCVFGQKKPLDHSVYDNWKNIGGFDMTEDAKYTLFYISAQEGDGCIVAHNLVTNEQNAIPRGTSYKITSDGKFAAFSINPKFEEREKV